MRYLQVPSRFHFSTPSLFRRRSSGESSAGASSVGHLPRSMQRPGPRTTAGRGFAVKFYDILSQESSDIITWTESGQAFQVVDYTRFSEEILLKYFRHNKFSSFRRQLNLYGYRKVIKGPDAGAYMHPSFQRGRPDLLGEVKKGKVPHYDMHGVNEIHGQHFRHHPPGVKNKENAEQAKMVPAHMTTNPHSSPVTPEIHGGAGYPTPHGVPGMMGNPALNASAPAAGGGHMTPGTQAATAMSNMSLSPMPHASNAWSPQPGQGIDALTLTPAFAGPGVGYEGDAASGPAGGGPAGSLNEKHLGMGKLGGGGSGGTGGGGTSSGGGGERTGMRMAYWEKSRKRRTLSAQLVFPVQPPNNTETIDQPDPSLCDVMDVICQCMEVQSSSESQLSALSGCSFKKESMRRSSISDLLNCMSWESALRGSGIFRGSLAGTLDGMYMEEQGDTADSGGGGIPPTGAPTFGQQPSFDPTRDPSGEGSGLMGGMMQPAVIASSPLSSAGGGGGGGGMSGSGQPERGGDGNNNQRRRQHESRPSFDPNRESSIATGIREAAGKDPPRIPGGRGDVKGGTVAAAAGGGGGDTVVSADEVTGEAFLGGGGGGAAPPGPMTRENSRESTAARIFKSAPARPPPATTSGAPVSRGDSGYQTWGSERGSRRGSGASTSASAEANNKGQVQWVLSSTQPQQQQQGAAGTKTSSTWGLPLLQEGPAHGQDPGGGVGGLTRVSASTPNSSLESSPSVKGEMLLSRPGRLARMSSMQWLTEPVPSRRPTMNESHEVNRLLAKPSNFEAWTRVSDDPDSLMLAKSIGDYLG